MNAIHRPRGSCRVSIRVALILLLSPGLNGCRNDVARTKPYSLEAPQYDLVEVFRLGGVEPSEPEMFDRVPLAIIDGADTLFVLHKSQGQIAVFAPDGEFVRWIRGGRGNGPGEFTSAGRMGLVHDTLWVRNMSPPRISQFLTSGRHVSTRAVPLPQPHSTMVGAQGISGYLGKGRAWLEPDAPPQALQEGHHPEAHLELTVRSGDLSSRDTVLTWRSARGRLAGLSFNPVPEPPFFSIAADGSGIAVAEWSDQTPTVLLLRVIDADGSERWTAQVPVQAIPVAKSEQDSLTTAAKEQVIQLREQLLGYGLSEGGIPKVPSDEELRTRVYLPSHRPPVRSIHLGVDGTVWLELHEDRRWVAVDERARALLQVRLPETAVLHQATRESIWYTETDELGVPTLVRARLEALLAEASANR